MQLYGVSAVITGAGSGLGREFAIALARRGCRVGVTDIRLDRAEETLRMVEDYGGRGEVLLTDVADPSSVEGAAAHFFGAWGGVDLLINNAGVVSVGQIGDIPLEDWQWQYSVNLWGVVHGCHFFVPRMKRQGHGHILNVASSAGLFSLLEMSPYNTTKAAVISLSETLRAELAPLGIGVTVLCPMFFNTNLLQNWRYTDDFERELAQTAFNYARMGAGEVAEAGLKAVEKGRLYCIPQLSGRLLWLAKRSRPELFYRVMARMNSLRRGRELFLWMVRKGLLQ